MYWTVNCDEMAKSKQALFSKIYIINTKHYLNKKDRPPFVINALFPKNINDILFHFEFYCPETKAIIKQQVDLSINDNHYTDDDGYWLILKYSQFKQLHFKCCIDIINYKL